MGGRRLFYWVPDKELTSVTGPLIPNDSTVVLTESGWAEGYMTTIVHLPFIENAYILMLS
jgi:hypothetical protein